MNKPKMNFFAKNSTRLMVSDNYLTNGHMILDRNKHRQETEYLINKAKLDGKDIKEMTDKEMRDVTPWDIENEAIGYTETPLFYKDYKTSKQIYIAEGGTLFAYDEKYLAILDEMSTSLHRRVLVASPHGVKRYYLTNEDESFILMQMTVDMPFNITKA